MEPAALEDALLALASRLGIPVRHETFDKTVFADLGARGGLCTLAGERVILVDRDLPTTDRVEILLRALAGLGWDDVLLASPVRHRLERARRRRSLARGGKRARLRVVKPR